jgi:hypothetical protein
VKRSVADESTWVASHLYMETMLESLCIAILSSTGKNTLSFLYLHMFSLLPGSEEDVGEREGVG